MPESKRVLIVGGVAGGASAAARARRLSEDAEIVLFERGAHVSFANCGLPYHISGVIPDRDRLFIQSAEGLRRRFRIDVRTETEVRRIDRDRREVLAFDRRAGREYREPYDALILSTGAEPVRPPIPGIDSSRVRTLRSIADMDAIQRCLAGASSGRAVIVGGGYVGLEMAETLRRRGLEVTLIELANQVLAPVDPEMAAMIHQELALNGVDLRLGTSVTEFRETEKGVTIALSKGAPVDAVIAVLAIGVRPETELARSAGIEIGALGGIAVDERLRTSDPAVYAVGDAIETPEFTTGAPALLPLAGPANRQGRIAADNIFGRQRAYKRTQGTAICKVFGIAVGMTGLNEKRLLKAKTPYEKVYVHTASHAGYYPGAAPIALKLLFSPSDGKILGAQAVGADGVDKRIDVLATAQRAGLTVYDLEDLELSYAPPYGAAKDAVNYAGFVVANALRKDVRLCHAEDFQSPPPDKVFLDVRTPDETAAGSIPGAVNIPLDDLRGRLAELPKEKEILVFCQVGLRGYLACRILSQNGFSCRNLSGGYKTWRLSTGSAPAAGRTKEKEMTTDTGAAPAAAAQTPAPAVLPAVRIDARGLQCPGPIQKLASGIGRLRDGETLEILATDPGFASDAPAWCRTTGNEMRSLVREGEAFRATVTRQPKPAGALAAPGAGGHGLTIVVFNGDFDRVMAAFIIANGAATMGWPATMFFTFWGLNALRRDQPVRVKKNLIERMFGWMMPRGAERLALSRMHMAGMGRAMIKGIMRKKKVASLTELITDARKSGVRLVACRMSMDLMGIKPEELIDGTEQGGVASYLERADAGAVNLFV
jgi:NADPH-dependent 2,4-dienoyl-CoA reductase/sulfur reductase-like enzyme/peroxiredoxin family protein/rhodanese-related sulfurtransferase/TusA-related sulfurtransferase